MSRTADPADVRPRMAPPRTLTADEAKVWKALVRAVASDHFAPCDRPLISEYCRAVALADKAAKALEDGAVLNGKASPWISIQEKAVRAIVAISMRLRVAPQSRFDRLKAGTSARQGIPTFDPDDDDLLARPLTGLASFR